MLPGKKCCPRKKSMGNNRLILIRESLAESEMEWRVKSQFSNTPGQLSILKESALRSNSVKFSAGKLSFCRCLV